MQGERGWLRQQVRLVVRSVGEVDPTNPVSAKRGRVNYGSHGSMGVGEDIPNLQTR